MVVRAKMDRTVAWTLVYAERVAVIANVGTEMVTASDGAD